MLRYLKGALLALAITNTPALAQDVRITPNTSSYTIEINGKQIMIARNQDTEATITPDFAKTSRPCPPFCIAPISAGPGVETVGELEVIAFLEKEVASGTGLLIDARVPEWFQKGTIPGAVNVPFSTLDPSNPYRNQILTALGASQRGSRWDFSGAPTLTLFCNGPWCEQSPRAIKNLLEAGYPANKIKYYRGGMQVWLLLGLTVQNPNA